MGFDHRISNGKSHMKLSSGWVGSLTIFQFDTIQLSKARLLMFKKGIMIVEPQADIYIVIVMAS